MESTGIRRICRISHIRQISLIGLFILTLLLSLRLIFFFPKIPNLPNGTKIRLTARVSSEPIQYSTSQYLKLSGYKVYLPLYPRIYYGDRIIVEGTVTNEPKSKLVNCHPEAQGSHPELAGTEQNRSVSESVFCFFERFRNKFGMTVNKKLARVKLISIDERKGFLYQYRQKLISFYERSLPKDHAAIVSGVVIGSKSGIGDELWEKLKRSGTAHVVVASGMNISMVSKFLIGFLILITSRRKAQVIAFIGIWIYAIISGFDAPIVRASVMASLAFLAVESGRMYSSLRILLITGVALLFLKPVWTSDLGFWLSILATGSIIIFYPKVQKFFSFVPKVLREDWSTTLSAQIGVVPLLYYYFGQFSILSPFINVAVLWTIVPITIIGMIAGVVGTIIEPLGQAVLYLIYPLTSWFLWVVSIFV